VAHARVSATSHLKHKTKSERVPAAAFRVSKKQACFGSGVVLGFVCFLAEQFILIIGTLFTRKLDHCYMLRMLRMKNYFRPYEIEF
jgi:hypothetical protein